MGALSETRDPSSPYSRAGIAGAGASGWTSPRLGSYALSDLGALAGGASPIGGLPEPDLFYACDSQCAVVARWGDDVQSFFRTSRGKDIPPPVHKAPPLTRAAQHTAAELAGFKAQLDAHLDQLAARFGLR